MTVSLSSLSKAVGSSGTSGYSGVAGPSTTINATANGTSTTLYPVMVSSIGSSQTAWANTKIVYDASNIRLGIGVTPTSTLHVQGNIQDSKGESRTLIINTQSVAYGLATTDHGKTISTSANVTVPNAVFSAGEVVTIYNNSTGSITVLPNTSVTMYLSGTATTGNRTLAQRGLATVLCVAANTFVISGAGIS